MSSLIDKLQQRANQAEFIGNRTLAKEYALAVDTIKLQEERISDLMGDKLELAKLVARLRAEIDGHAPIG